MQKRQGKDSCKEILSLKFLSLEIRTTTNSAMKQNFSKCYRQAVFIACHLFQATS